MIYFRLISMSLVLLFSCKTKNSSLTHSLSNMEEKSYFINIYGDTIPKMILSEFEWQNRLSKEEFYVLRKKGTERAFTGSLLKIKDRGLYCCKGCGTPLFHSKHKFDSGTGWPSFYDVVDINALKMETDYDIGYPRTEVMCGRCGGHMGHVFEDGPKPTGLRYCINSVSLEFVKEEN